MTPYFQRDQVVLYHGDCRDLLPMLVPDSVGLLLTDPPYGIGLRTDYLTRKRGTLKHGRDFLPIYGDDAPFDPTHLLGFPRLILFGANHYASRLPVSNSWLVWDKLAGLTSKRTIGFNDQGDAELAWTNLGGPVRLIPHRWTGMLKASERRQIRLHPTQKPVALMAWLIRQYALPGTLILDPYMGAGSTVVAAQALGHPVIGVEIEETYCALAVQRLAQLPLWGVGGGGP